MPRGTQQLRPLPAPWQALRGGVQAQRPASRCPWGPSPDTPPTQFLGPGRAVLALVTQSPVTAGPSLGVHCFGAAAPQDRQAGREAAAGPPEKRRPEDGSKDRGRGAGALGSQSRSGRTGPPSGPWTRVCTQAREDAAPGRSCPSGGAHRCSAAGLLAAGGATATGQGRLCRPDPGGWPSGWPPGWPLVSVARSWVLSTRPDRCGLHSCWMAV